MQGKGMTQVIIWLGCGLLSSAVWAAETKTTRDTLTQPVASNASSSAQAPAPTKQKPKWKSKPASVIAYRVVPLAIPVDIEVLGALQSNAAVNITANVTETVTKLHFEDGQQVKKGQLLVTLNSREEAALQEEAKEIAEEAKRQYDRVKEIEGRGTVTRSLVDERYRQWKAAEAKQKVIAAQLADRRLYAPFSGQLGFRQLSEGALVQSGTKIVSLDDTRHMKLDMLIPSRYLANLSLGQAVRVHSNAYPKQTFTGKISAISPRVQADLRMVQVRALVNNPKHLLKSEMLVKAFLHLPTEKELMIPNTAILMLGDRQFVYRLKAKPNRPDTFSVEQVEIDTGERRAKFTQVLSGLTEGDAIVSQGIMQLSDKKTAKVMVWQDGQKQSELVQKKPTKSSKPEGVR